MLSLWRFVLLSWALVWPLACTADTLLDYTGSYPFAFSPGVPVTYASSFTVGALDVEITAIEFRLGAGASPSGADTTAYIFSDSGGQPGALIGSSEQDFAPGELAEGRSFYNYTFAAPLVLTSGATYWAALGISPIGELPYVSYTPNLGEFVSNGIAPSLSLAESSYAPGGWSVVPAATDTLVYKLDGVAVPEPSAFTLVLFGLGLLPFKPHHRR